jgi:flagellar transcriptional activator FlhC
MKPISIKSKSSIATDLLIMERLIQYGARPPIISQLCHLSRKQSIAFFKSVQGQSPKQGMLPHDHQWPIRSALNNIHASLFLSIFEDIKNHLSTQKVTATGLLDAYEIYNNVATKILAHDQCPQPRASRHYPLNINRAWYLIGLLSVGNLVFILCGRCQARYLGMIHPDAVFSQCPICDVWTDRSERRRWTSSKSKTLRLCKSKAG